MDHLVIIDEQDFFVGDFEAIAIASQSINRATGKDIHSVPAQRGQIKCRVDDNVTVIPNLDLDIGNNPAKTRFRILSVRRTTFEPSNAVLQACPVLVNNGNMTLRIDVVVVGRNPVQRIMGP